MANYYLVVNDQIVGKYSSLKDANEALEKRQAKDQAVDQSYEFVYQLLKENV